MLMNAKKKCRNGTHLLTLTNLKVVNESFRKNSGRFPKSWRFYANMPKKNPVTTKNFLIL